ncbi:hypothetical protein EIP86_007555 [Pleurotus ostreatoroseus]|nr:hypothetical protein EIP86_007555 [Pleurotus ostreatoroseus]
MGTLKFSQFFFEQWTRLPPPLQSDLAQKVVMVTGATTGIGLEAAKTFASMHPKKLIVACRSEDKGKATIATIEQATGYRGTSLAVFDQEDFGSIIKYAESVKDEPLDILVANAGLAVRQYKQTGDGWETTLQVNHLATALLSLLLLPNLIRTGQANGTTSRLSIVSSDNHYWVKLEEELLDAPNLLQMLNDEGYCADGAMQRRYPVSKLLNVLFARALAEHLPASVPLIVNSVNPGFCYSQLRRSVVDTTSFAVRLWFRDLLLGRTAEQGARQLVWAALGPDGREGVHTSWMRGAYVSTQSIKEPSDFVISQDGGRAQEKVYEETLDILSKFSPDVRAAIETYLA